MKNVLLKKTICVIASFALVAGLMPATAFADEAPEETTPITEFAEIESEDSVVVVESEGESDEFVADEASAEEAETPALDEENAQVETDADDVTEATAEEAEEILSASFYAERMVDGVKIIVSAPAGVLPDGATLSVSKLSYQEENQALDAVEAIDTTENVQSEYAFDITIFDANGAEVQPNTKHGNVEVSFQAEASNALDVNVYHIPDQAQAEKLNVVNVTPVGSEVKVTAETSGFSTYVVKFGYGSLDYVVTDNGTILLADLLAELGITPTTELTLDNITVSDPTAINVEKNRQKKLEVIVLKSFTNAVTLTVVDGSKTYQISITCNPSGYMTVSPRAWAYQFPDYGSDVKFTQVIGGGHMYVGGTYTASGSTESDILVLSSTGGDSNRKSAIALDGKTEIGSLLSGLSGYPVGGDLSYVEMEMQSLGTRVFFDYAFCSSEFDQGAQYNDSFGLFISTQDGSGNWSAYQNIAIIPGKTMAVNIQNLKSAGMWTSSGSIQGVSTDVNSKSGKGYTTVFHAEKTGLEVGQNVRILFAICDISDAGYDSAVAIKAHSLGFGAPTGIPDYILTDEFIENLKPGKLYKLTVDGVDYEITAKTDPSSSSNGIIPFEGTDNSGNTYNTWGKDIELRIYDTAEGGWSLPQELHIIQKYTEEAPEDPTAPSDEFFIINPDATSTVSSITVTNVNNKQVYFIYGPDGEILPGYDPYYLPAAGETEFTISGLPEQTTYTIKTAYYPSHDHPISHLSDGINVTTKNMITDDQVVPHNYTGTYDGLAHSATATSTLDNVVVYYSETQDGEYTTTVPEYTTAGNYTVYYKVTKDGYYTSWGSLSVKIAKATLTATYAGETIEYSHAPELVVAVEGFVNGETAATAAGYVAPTIQGTIPTAIGEYQLTPSGAQADNYNFNVVPGMLKITKPWVYVYIKGAQVTNTYDGDAHTATGWSVKSKSQESFNTNTISYNGTASASQTNVGTTYMNLDTSKFRSSDSNWEAVFVIDEGDDGYQAITPANAVVKANDKHKTYGASDPSFDATVTGTVKGQTLSYDFERTEGENAGEYTITPTGNETQGNYTVEFQPGTLFIDKSDALTLNASSYSDQYDGTTHASVITVNPVEGTTLTYSTDGGTTWSTQVPSITHVGSASYMVKASNNNYNEKTVKFTLTVTPRQLVVKTSSATRPYNGDPLTAEGSVTNQAPNEIITITTTGSQTNVGSSSNTYVLNYGTGVQSTDYMVGSESIGTLEVSQLDLGDAIAAGLVTIEPIPAQTYIRTGCEPTVIVKFKGEPMALSTDYTTAYSNNTAVTSEAVATVTGTGNFKGSVPTLFTIDPKVLDLKWSDTSLTYTGFEQGPSVVATNIDEGDTCNLTLSEGSKAINAGNAYMAEVVKIDNPNYALPQYPKQAYVIAKANLANVVISPIADQTYNGSPLTPEVVATLGNYTLTEDDYRTFYTDNLDAGTGYVALLEKQGGSGNFEGYQQTDFNILQRAAVNTSTNRTVTYAGPYSIETADKPLFVKDAEAGAPTYALLEGGTGEGKIVDGVLIPTKAGTFVIQMTTAETQNVLEGKIAVTLTIEPAPVVVTVDEKTKEYGDEDPALTVQYKGLVNGESESLIAFSIKRDAGENVGQYDIIAKGDAEQGNYTVKFVQNKLTITPIDASEFEITLADDGDVVFTARELQPTITTIICRGKTLEEGVDYRVISDPETTLGEHDLIIEGLGNYTGTTDAVWNIIEPEHTDVPGIDEKTGYDEAIEHNDNVLDETFTEIMETISETEELPEYVEEGDPGLIMKALAEGDTFIMEVIAGPEDESLVSDEEKKLAEQALENAAPKDYINKMVMYVDGKVFMKNARTGEIVASIHQTTDPIIICIQLDDATVEKIQNHDMFLFRIHNGVAEQIEFVVNGNELIFGSDLFSTFALGTTEQPPAKVLPQTGDTKSLLPLGATLTASFSLMLMALYARRRAQEE